MFGMGNMAEDEAVLVKVFSYLTPQELYVHVFPVCRKWEAIARRPCFWHHLTIADGDLHLLQSNGPSRLLPFASLQRRESFREVLLSIGAPLVTFKYLSTDSVFAHNLTGTISHLMKDARNVCVPYFFCPQSVLSNVGFMSLRSLVLTLTTFSQYRLFRSAPLVTHVGIYLPRSEEDLVLLSEDCENVMDSWWGTLNNVLSDATQNLSDFQFLHVSGLSLPGRKISVLKDNFMDNLRLLSHVMDYPSYQLQRMGWNSEQTIRRLAIDVDYGQYCSQAIQWDCFNMIFGMRHVYFRPRQMSLKNWISSLSACCNFELPMVLTLKIRSAFLPGEDLPDAIVTHFRAIDVLFLESCAISRTGMSKIFEQCQFLKNLLMGDVELNGGRPFFEVIPPNLKLLVLHNCDEVDEEEIIQLGNRYPNLTIDFIPSGLQCIRYLYNGY